METPTMTTHARNAVRNLMALTSAVLLLASCGWEVGADSAAQGLDQGNDGGACETTTSLTGYPKRGVHFSAELWGECNDCNDRSCRQSNGDGWHDCVCAEEAELCWAQPMITLPDGGIQPDEFCAYQGQRCDCGGGLGPVERKRDERPVAGDTILLQLT